MFLSFRTLITLLIFAVGGVIAGTPIVLTSNNFDELTHIGNNVTGEVQPWLVKAFAPWCPHCRKLAPKWEQLVDKVDLNVAEIDCTLEKHLCKRFHVKGYPTILLFANDKMYKYKGSRKVSKLVDFALGGYSSFEGQDIPKEESNLKGRVNLDADRNDNITQKKKKSWLDKWF